MFRVSGVPASPSRLRRAGSQAADIRSVFAIGNETFALALSSGRPQPGAAKSSSTRDEDGRRPESAGTKARPTSASVYQLSAMNYELAELSSRQFIDEMQNINKMD